MRDTWKGWGSITKSESRPDGSIEVTGVASTEAVDSDGEVVTAEAMRQAIPGFMAFGAVREMHQPLAAGRALSMHVDAEGVTHLAALIVDSEAVKKVRAGVLKGYSIGGKVKRRNAHQPHIIEALDLVEVSLVDRPANPEARLTMWKLDAHDTGALLAGQDAGEAADGPATGREHGKDPEAEEHHRGRCHECGGRLVCLPCLRAAGGEKAALAGLDGDLLRKFHEAERRVAEAAWEETVARKVARTAERERADALAKVAAWARHADRLEKRLRDAEEQVAAAERELRRRPKGAVRVFAVEKGADVSHTLDAEPRPDDARSLIRRAHASPSPMAGDGGPWKRG